MRNPFRSSAVPHQQRALQGHDGSDRPSAIQANCACRFPTENARDSNTPESQVGESPRATTLLWGGVTKKVGHLEHLPRPDALVSAEGSRDSRPQRMFPGRHVSQVGSP